MTLATPEYLREIARSGWTGKPAAAVEGAIKDAADEIESLTRQLAEARAEIERLKK